MGGVEIVSAETFRAFELAHSSFGLCSRQPDMPAKVRAITYGGKHYTVLARHWWNQVRCTVEAYELIPLSEYNGKSTIDAFDPQVIRAEFLLTDFTGLMVEVDDARMVCARRQTFECGLPSGRPMCFRAAMLYSEAQEDLSWRKKYQAKPPQVFSLNGHPVFKYMDARTGHCDVVLLWRNSGQVEEIRLDRSTPLEGVPAHVLHELVAIPA